MLTIKLPESILNISIMATLKKKESIATPSMTEPMISGGSKNRHVASYIKKAVIIHITKMEPKAPRISTRWYPKVYLSSAYLCAMDRAQIEIPKPKTSDAI